MQEKLASSICIEDTKVFTLKWGRKNSWFDYHRRFLDMIHTYRCSKYGFRTNTIESEEALVRPISQQIWDRVRRFPKITKVRKFVRLPGYGVEHNWTKQNIF